MKLATVTLVLSLASASAASVPQRLCGDHAGAPSAESKSAPAGFSEPQKPGTQATCIVSGEQFAINASTLHSEYKGKHYYFCCPGCKTQFDKNPDKFTNRSH